jgi:ribosomal protein L37E
MPELKTDRKLSFYTCGRCNGNISYLKSEGKPDVCPECGYGHGTRDVNDVPPIVNLDLNSLADTDSGSRGNLEDTTITSR